MRIALAQMDVVPGKIGRNVAAMKELVAEYETKGFDVIAFPELCVGGYLVGDLWYEPDWIDAQLEAADSLLSLLREGAMGISVIFGCPRKGKEGERNEDGRPRLYNSAWFARWDRREGRMRLEHADKRLLPNYRFFDDKRYFHPGSPSRVFDVETRDGSRVSIGMEVCEDLWHEDYASDPTADLCAQGAKYVFNLSASPHSHGKRRARDRVIRDTLSGASSSSLDAFLYVNCVGAQNNGKNVVTFDGDTGVFSGSGAQLAGIDAPFERATLEFDTDAPRAPFETRERSKTEGQFLACVEGIRSLDSIMGNAFPYVIGVSGGIDSAVVLCLLERAVGGERIRAVSMPGDYTSDATRDNARRIAGSLGADFREIPIAELVALQERTLALAGIAPTGFNLENMQAKTRGTVVLSNIAGVLGGVMTNNGNKLELALGYSTLYGDVNGAIAPIGDLLKVEVWDLARYLNDEVYGREVIPRNLIVDEATWDIPLPPSAELRANQVDPMKWGYHDALLVYLSGYGKGSVARLLDAYGRSPSEFARLVAEGSGALLEPELIGRLLVKYGLVSYEAVRDDLGWFLKAVGRGVFKRIQAPPVVVQSESAYGYDIRESQLPQDRLARSGLLEPASEAAPKGRK